MSSYPEAWAPRMMEPRMTEAWTQHPPDPGDADYLAYLDAQDAEAGRLAAVIEPLRPRLAYGRTSRTLAPILASRLTLDPARNRSRRSGRPKCFPPPSLGCLTE